MLGRRPTYRNASLSATSRSSSDGDSLILPAPTSSLTDNTPHTTLPYSHKRYFKIMPPSLDLPMFTAGEGSHAPTAGTVSGASTEVLPIVSTSLPVSVQTDIIFDDAPIGLRVRSSPYARGYPISAASIKEQLRQPACTASWSSYIASHNATALALAYGFAVINQSSDYNLEPKNMCCQDCHITPFGIKLLKVIGPQGSRCIEPPLRNLYNVSEVDNKSLQGISVTFLHEKAIALPSLYDPSKCSGLTFYTASSRLRPFANLQPASGRLRGRGLMSEKSTEESALPEGLDSFVLPYRT